MAITLNYPALPSGTKNDSSKYAVDRTDPAIRDETEGGYTITRPRTTRKPRRSWKLGYTHIDSADRATLDAFWDTTMGGSRIFNWQDPESLVTYQVRFKEPLAWTFVGKGALRRWDCSYTLEQA